MTETKARTRRSVGRGDTRSALIEGALKLLDGNKSFDGLSLREVTREVGVVPTAFYRHFADMDELGLAIVDESFFVLRKILEDMRRETKNGTVPIKMVLSSLMHHVQKNRLRFRFIASERYSGAGKIRLAVRREMRLVQSELATDLARLPLCSRWSTADLQMAAGLILNNLIAIADEVLEQAKTGRVDKKDLMELGEKQLRLIILGMPLWRSKTPV